MHPARPAFVCAALALLASAPALAADAGVLVPVSGPSPFAGCLLDTPRAQPGRFTPDSEVEPRLAVDPGDPLHLVGVFQQDRWTNGGSRGLVAGVSFDGGATWRTEAIPGLTPCSGGSLRRASDPWVTIAPNGDVYQAGLGLNEVARRRSPTGVLGSAIVVSKSTDGGLTWGAALSLVEDFDGSVHDKESVIADPTDPASRRVYAVWDRVDPDDPQASQPALFSRTTDAGGTWEAPREIYDPGPANATLGHQILVLPDGTLVDAFTEFVSFLDRSGRLRYRTFLSLLRSPDQGKTWMGPDGSAQRAVPLAPRGTFDPDDGRFDVRTGDGLVDVAVDPVDGSLYAAWQDSRFTGGDRDGIGLALSTDAGFHWSEPISIEQTPSGLRPADRQAFTPSVRVAADGSVGVTYYDFRNDTPGGAALTDYWLVRCDPRRADCARREAWGREVRLTDASFDIRAAPFALGFFVGDYEGLGSDGGDFLVFFSQPHDSDPASVFFRRVRP